MKLNTKTNTSFATIAIMGTLVAAANGALIIDNITSNVAPTNGSLAALIDGAAGPVGSNSFGAWQDAANPTLTFSFNAPQTINNVAIWQNGGNIFTDAQGWKNFSLSFYNSSNTLVGGEFFINVPTALSGGDPWISDSFLVSDVSSIVMTSLDSLGTKGSSTGSSEYVAREIAFNVVPEPSSTLLLGVGAFGLLVRRNKR